MLTQAFRVGHASMIKGAVGMPGARGDSLEYLFCQMAAALSEPVGIGLAASDLLLHRLGAQSVQRASGD